MTTNRVAIWAQTSKTGLSVRSRNQALVGLFEPRQGDVPEETAPVQSKLSLGRNL